MISCPALVSSSGARGYALVVDSSSSVRHSAPPCLSCCSLAGFLTNLLSPALLCTAADPVSAAASVLNLAAAISTELANIPTRLRNSLLLSQQSTCEQSKRRQTVHPSCSQCVACCARLPPTRVISLATARRHAYSCWQTRKWPQRGSAWLSGNTYATSLRTKLARECQAYAGN